MGTRAWVGLSFAGAMLVSAWSAGAEPATAPTFDGGVQLVTQRKEAAWREVLASFDERLRAAPDDVSLAVARCRFIGNFADPDYGDWIEAASDEFDACSEALKTRWEAAPEARMFVLEQLWGEEASEQGEAFIESSADWPLPLRRQLFAYVSRAHENMGNASRAGELALEGVRLGDTSRLGAAVAYLASRKQFADAARLLADTPPGTEAFAAGERVEAALQLPDSRAALRELKRHGAAGSKVDALVAARAYLQAGDVAGARRLLGDVNAQAEGGRHLQFDIAMAAGDHARAAALVDLTRVDQLGENLARFATLAKKAPVSLATAPMLLAALLVMLFLGALALLPGLVIVPAHYRGLMRRVQGRAPTPLFQAVGLRRAWYAAAVMLCIPLAVGMLAEPGAMSVMIAGDTLPQGPTLYRMMLWGAVAGVLCLLPGLRGMQRRQLVGDLSVVRGQWGAVLVAWGLLVVVGMLLSFVHGQTGTGGDTMQTKAIEAMATGARDAYGITAALLLGVVVGPVFEELVFRGLLLGGLSRHISFGWANVWQAALFAMAHDDLPRFPFYFTLGLLGGWLVRRSNSLLPAIALHALNNTLALLPTLLR